MVQLNKLIEKLGLPFGSDLWVSVVFICLTLAIAQILRSAVNVILPRRESFSRKLALEFIASAELCAGCFENCIIADNYGVTAYAVVLFLLCIWWGMKWEEETACPYDYVEDYVVGKSDTWTVLIVTVVQCIGGFLVYPYYITYLWGLRYENRHLEKVSSEDCEADMQQISTLLGALVEGGGTFICQMTAKFLAEKEISFGNAINAFVGTSLVVAAFDLSGGYYNPMLASALQFGCLGASNMDHFIVYWVGSICGSIASVLVFNHPQVQKILFEEKKIKSD